MNSDRLTSSLYQADGKERLIGRPHKRKAKAPDPITARCVIMIQGAVSGAN